MVVEHPDGRDQDIFGHLGQQLLVQLEAVEEMDDSTADRATRAPPEADDFIFSLAKLLVSPL